MFSPILCTSISTSDPEKIYVVRVKKEPSNYKEQLEEKKTNIYKSIIDDDNKLYYPVVIQKEKINKDIELPDQKTLFDWLFSNIDIISENNNILDVIDEQSSLIYQSTRLSSANTMVVGKNILNDIKDNLSQDYYSYKNEKYDGDDYIYVGTYKNINVYTPTDSSIIPDDTLILSYTGSNSNSGLISHNIDGINYLQVITPTGIYNNNYSQYIRIINFKKEI